MPAARIASVRRPPAPPLRRGLPRGCAGRDRLNRGGSEKETRQVVLATGAERFLRGRRQPRRSSPQLPRAGRRDHRAARRQTGHAGAVARRCRAPAPRRAGADAAKSAGPSDQAIEVLASRALDRDELLLLQAMAEGYPGAGPGRRRPARSARSFPVGPAAALRSWSRRFDPLQPRLYSIASSPKHAAGEVHLTVAAVRYEQARPPPRRASPRPISPTASLPAKTFRSISSLPTNFAPAAPDAPLIMIGPGTGIAPFRAFLQERRAAGAAAATGCSSATRAAAATSCSRTSCRTTSRDGLLTRLDTAFSRDQDERSTSSTDAGERRRTMGLARRGRSPLRLRRRAAHGARCRSGARLHRRQAGRHGPAAAKAYLARLAREGRYQKDVY